MNAKISRLIEWAATTWQAKVTILRSSSFFSWTEARLTTIWWTVIATVRSVANFSIDYYPRIRRGSDLDDLGGDKLVYKLAEATESYKKLIFKDAEEGSRAIELAKASLEEAKRQTEYQDDKASRLLTVTSFVSALSAVLLSIFTARYPLDELHPGKGGANVLIAACYIVFLLFTLSALLGGVVTFHATRTRFKYAQKPTASGPDDKAKSMLFYQEMIAVSPQGWADSFVTVSPAASGGQQQTVTLRSDLQVAYFRNYVVEGYLIAAKTADKLRYLSPGQSLLAWALRFLVLFVALFAFAICTIPKTRAQPTPVSIVFHPRAAEPILGQSGGSLGAQKRKT